MVQAVEVFIDSSVLVEYIKDRKVALLNYLLKHQRDLAINSTVISEFLFYFIGFKGNKSPMTLKRDSSIGTIIEQNDPVAILEDFTVLPESSDTALVVSLMKKHNLLPNDALILATCLRHKIPYLASYDVTDFASACATEGIVLLSDAEEAKRHIPSA
jgi:predicted nucleic acid-binding protein